MGAHTWLDLARYAGLGRLRRTTRRNDWPYRDYVIRSSTRTNRFEPIHDRTDRRRSARQTRDGG